MSRAQNPYEPPRYQGPKAISWWERLRRALSGLPTPSDDERFLAGETVIHYGVVFRVDPNDEESFTASLPLVRDTEEYVRRNVEEACRVAAEFLAAHPKLIESLRNRKLIVSMISSYEDRDHEIRRVVIPAEGWNHRLELNGG